MHLYVKKIRPDAILPKYALPDDAGMDLYASETVVLQSNEKKGISTGIAMAIPKGHVGLVWDKSGLASKFHLHTLAGVIDETYRGEIIVIVGNFGKQPYTIEKGKKIAQLLIQPILHPVLEEVDELNTTLRGSSGFGSTGMD
ncbi:MAG: dUTP diphosphatase [Candidatus Diapherotrites archaeon]